jgi:hypothetical protein
MPASPSLLIVPARFKTGKLYTQIATTSAGVVLASSGDFNVTRATTATRFNSAGLIESVASGVPRLDYYTSGGTAGCPALLVEPSGSNLALQSENFLTTWAPTNITVTTGTTAAFTAPDGTTTADLLTASASGSARINQSFTFVSGTTYSYSAFAKAGSGFFGLTMENGGVASGAAVIWNLNTGALAVSGVVGAGYTLQSQGIENYGNGWYRCRITVLLGLGAAGNIRANTSDGTMSAAIINSASGNTAYVWGAQLETGSVATSYIPTTTAAVTRNADVINLSGAVSGCIGQTEGTLYAEVDIKQLPALNARTFIDVGSSGNRVFMGFTSLASNTLRFQIDAGVGGIACVDIRDVVANAGIVKVAVAYQSLNCALYVNGVQATNIQSNIAFSFTTALSALFLGSTVSASAFVNDRIRAAALYTTRLTNAELAALTTL